MEEKGSYLKGVLTGALVASVIFIILVVSGIIPKKEDIQEMGIITPETQEKLAELNDLIDKLYLYDDKMDSDSLQNALIKGYIQGLDDPYSVYYDEAETQALLESTSGEFGGIGVTLSQNIDTKIITVVNVYKNSPGEAGGLLEGDILYKVNGEDITQQDIDTVVTKIKGDKGTKVEITVYRGENLEEYTTTITRDIIQVQTVVYEMKEDNIGYIQVSGFEKVTSAQFEAAIQDLTAQGMEKMIIDLRNNPGGNLSTVCEMADLILPEGTIVYTEDKNGKRETYKSDEARQVDMPIVVLVNGNSASAAEIFAGALKDHKKATLVGTTTYGKGIVQQINPLKDGTSLKLTISEYFTPSGENIHGKGIKPDIEVKREYDAANPTRDNQLEEAIKALKN